MAARQSRSAAAPARLDNADPVGLREFILLFEAWPSRRGPRATTVVRPQKPQWPLGDQRPTTLHLGVALVGWRESQWPPRHAPIDGYLFLSLRAPTWRANVSLCRHRLRDGLRRYPPARSCCFLSFSDSIRSARCMGRACNPTVHPAAMADAVSAPRKPLPTISRPLVGRAARIDSAQVSFVATLPA